jgi:hypothetical protein
MQDEVLEAIESLEMRSLRWGFADGSLSEDEAFELAQRVLAGRGDPEQVIDQLLRAGLLLEVWAPGDERRLRSRFAEIVRLLSRLRQIFPDKPWASAPRLVSDFRVDTRRRRYPDRGLPAGEVFVRAAGDTASPLRQALWLALTGGLPGGLADFQEDAARRLFHAQGDEGLIVTAGTGSGKTLAFYLPALVRIAETTRAGQFWTKTIAVYPRVELLKDQFAEAFRLARRLDPTVQAPRRQVIIGAYFGSTPNFAEPGEIARRGWLGRAGGFVCPWMPCPHCGGDLVWGQTDIAARRERLVCSNTQCRGAIEDHQIILTRNRLKLAPPDILFTTTEMLNQRLSDLDAWRLLGVGQPSGRRPFFALLDEVHTYVGAPGAQAALTLRRWRHAVDAPMTFVGLSATLREATQFFADLSGLDPTSVLEATPTAFVTESAEYQILVRNDPASQTSLLSTTIQTAMLLSRMLDPLQGGRSDRRFGSRLFAFADNLDVINRLFDSLRDAEGLSIFGRPRPGARPLADLRRPSIDGSDLARREADGQNWRVTEFLGRRLDAPLLVGRTASEDAGVEPNADVIIATAALEVGYNDDRVGAVLQHKAPPNIASFLQRRGRAGRHRGMRPLTVTVLADYGRDRVAFEAYEHLFDPNLPPQRLPVQNDYVLRMQATYALFDWLAAQAPRTEGGWAWDVLSQPPRTPPSGVSLRDLSKRRLVRLTEGDPDLIASLSRHLRQALKIDQETLDNILWRPPRALLLEAVPTLSRRLSRDWDLALPAPPSEKDLFSAYHPLPDYVARTLFSDLALPEVSIITPAATVNHTEKQRFMPIAPALQQLAPGRVTRRFAFERGGLHHWSPVDPDLPHQAIAISAYAEQADAIGVFEADGQRFDVYRPWRLRLLDAARHVAGPTSNAWLNWRTQLVAHGAPILVDLAANDPWRAHIGQIAFYLHGYRANLSVRRFAPDGEALLRRVHGDREITYAFVGEEGAPAAVGFEIDVDALQIRLDLRQAERLMAQALPADVIAGGRLAYFRHALLADPDMPADVDAYQRDWLHQILVAAALVRAAEADLDLPAAAADLLEAEDVGARLSAAMRAIFQSPTAPDVDDEVSDVAAGEDDDASEAVVDDDAPSAREQSLTDLFNRPDVVAPLHVLATQLGAPEPDAFARWQRETLVATLGEAVLQACASLAPRHASSDSLIVDVAIEPEIRITVSETTLGGAGVIQAIAEHVAGDPRALIVAIEAALAPTDLELAAEGLESFIGLVVADAEVARATADLRAASGHQARDTRRVRLYDLLSRRGLDVGHALSVSLNARLLAPGSGPELDRLVGELLGRWRALEARLGVAISVREIAYVFALDAAIRPRVAAAAGLAMTLDASETAQVLATLLWPKGLEISQRALQSHNPYVRRRRVTDPRLARSLVQPAGRRVSILAEGWRDSLATGLSEDGVVTLEAPATDGATLRTALLDAVITPVDVGFLQFFPRVERIERRGEVMAATLIVQEQV